MTLHVHQALWPQLEAEPGLRYVYEQHRDADRAWCSAASSATAC